MKQQEVFNKIGGIIKELNDQYKYLEATPEDLNDLELELFVANAHFLADHAEILFKLNAQSNAVKAAALKDESREERYFEPVVQHSVPDVQSAPVTAENDETHESDISADQPEPQVDLRTDSSEDSYSYIRQEPETIRHELVMNEAETSDWDEEDNTLDEVATPAEPQVIEEPVAPAKPDTPFEAEEAKVEEVKPITTVSEKSTPDEVFTINQKISAQLDRNNNKADQIEPISDLKQAITLNDKLLYVKDLFNGYSLAYSEVIDILNRYNTFDEADKFLKANYAVKNNWESKPETTDKFYALLKRRYA